MRRRWSPRQAQRLLSLVIARDGLACALCPDGRPVVLGLRARHPDGPSLDHIRPLSLGGTDNLANLRLAHFGCNAARGNRATTPSRRPVTVRPGFF